MTNIENTIKCVVIGDSMVGKTSFLITFTTGKFPKDYLPNVQECTDFQYEGRNISLKLYDTMGGENYDNFRFLSYQKTDVFLILYSVDSRSSADNILIKWVPEIEKYCPSVPYIIVGTKTDLRENQETIAKLAERNESLLPSFVGKKIALKASAYGYLECSSLLNEGLTEVFEEVVRQALDPETSLIVNKKKKKSGIGGFIQSIFVNEKILEDVNGLRKTNLRILHEEIKKKDILELERVKKIISDDVLSAREQRVDFCRLSEEQRLNILQHHICLNFRKYNGDHSCYELRGEFIPYLEELKMTREDVVLKCFGYFEEDKELKKRKIIQIFYNFKIDYDEGLVMPSDYIGIKHLPKFKESLLTYRYNIYFKNFLPLQRRKRKKIEIKTIEFTYIHGLHVFKKWIKRGKECEKIILELDGYYYSKMENLPKLLFKFCPKIRNLKMIGGSGGPQDGREYFHENGFFSSSSDNYDYFQKLKRIEVLSLIGEGFHRTMKLDFKRLLELNITGEIGQTSNYRSKFPNNYFSLTKTQFLTIESSSTLKKLFLWDINLKGFEDRIIKLVSSSKSFSEFWIRKCKYDYKCWRNCKIEEKKSIDFLFLLEKDEIDCGFLEIMEVFVSW